MAPQRIAVRRDILANWQTANPILDRGEPAWVSDTRDMIAGDGSSDFNTLWAAAQSIPNRAKASADAAAASASIATGANAFDPARDMARTLVGRYDASTLKQSGGTALAIWPDVSGAGQDLTQGTASARPTVTANGIGDKRIVTFPASGGKFLFQSGFGTGWGQPSGFPQPMTFLALVRVSSTGSRASNAAIISSNDNSTDRLSLLVDTNGSPAAIDGSGAGPSGAGPAINDDQWHVVAVVFDTNSRSIFVDGYLTGTTTGVGSTNSMKGLAIGAMPSGNAPFAGLDVAEVLVVADRLRPKAVATASDYLRTKWGLAPISAAQDAGAVAVDGVDSTGVAVRYWLPQGIDGVTPRGLVIWNHPSSHTQLVAPGYFAYPVIRAAVEAGWMVVATAGHGETWGNANVVADTTNAHTFMSAINPVGKVCLLGGSMGGLPSLLAAAGGAVPNVRGVCLIDGVTNLPTLYNNAAYTSLIDAAHGITRGTLSAAAAVGATTVSSSTTYTAGTSVLLGNGTVNAETVTVTATAGSGPYTLTISATSKAHASGEQVSDYPTQTAGRDPNLIAASSFPKIRYRFYAATSDATVPKATNADAMSAKLTTIAPLENTVVAHANGHIPPNASDPAGFTSFLGRL